MNESTATPLNQSGSQSLALDIRDLSVNFDVRQGQLQALRHVDLKVPAGEIVGLVGESGCGKSTLIGAVLQLLAENATIPEGKILLAGTDLLSLSHQQVRAARGREVSVVFQDPMTGLNPVLTIGRQMIDIQHREKISRREKRDRAIAILDMVRLPDPAARMNSWPHQLSGGQRQRVAIAMSLMMKPKLLIADEPTTALDATLEVQVIELLQSLQQEIGCAILFISHHLGVIAELCHRVVIMYAGETVEEGLVGDVFHRPAHPYTRKLVECDPGSIKTPTKVLPSIPGSLPDLVNPPKGCVFSDRCARAGSRCHEIRPGEIVLSDEHWAVCHFAQEIAADAVGRGVGA